MAEVRIVGHTEKAGMPVKRRVRGCWKVCTEFSAIRSFADNHALEMKISVRSRISPLSNKPKSTLVRLLFWLVVDASLETSRRRSNYVGARACM